MNHSVPSLLLSFILFFHSSLIYSTDYHEKIQGYITQIKKFSLKESNTSDFLLLLEEAYDFMTYLPQEEWHQTSIQTFDVQLQRLIQLAKKESFIKLSKGHQLFIKMNTELKPNILERIFQWMENLSVKVGLGVVGVLSFLWFFGDDIGEWLIGEDDATNADLITVKPILKFINENRINKNSESSISNLTIKLVQDNSSQQIIYDYIQGSFKQSDESKDYLSLNKTQLDSTQLLLITTFKLGSHFYEYSQEIPLDDVTKDSQEKIIKLTKVSDLGLKSANLYLRNLRNYENHQIKLLVKQNEDIVYEVLKNQDQLQNNKMKLYLPPGHEFNLQLVYINNQTGEEINKWNDKVTAETTPFHMNFIIY